MKRLGRIGIVGLLVVLAGCGTESRFLDREGELKSAWSAVSDRKFIRTIGIGVAPERIKDRTRRKGMARNSALIGARTELIALLKGVRIKGAIEVSSLAQQRDQLRQLVDTVVSGAEEERVEFTADDGCIVVLRIERSRVRQMLQQTARAEASDSEATISALEKQIALVDARTKAMLTTLPGMSGE